MLHLKQFSSPSSLFVLCVVFFVLEVSFLVHLSQQYLKVQCTSLGLSEVESVYLVKFF